MSGGAGPVERGRSGSTLAREVAHPPERPSARLPALTGLRFLAAALILVVHYYSAFGAPQYVLDLAGHHAVTFFFVLSGFILCYVYPELAGWKARGRFLLARLARIYPTHLASLALLVVLLPEVRPTILARPSVLVANLCLVQSWVPRESYYYSLNSPAWSISTELFFYACFPFLVVNWTRTWRMKLGLALAALAAVLLVAVRLPTTADGGPAAL